MVQEVAVLLRLAREVERIGLRGLIPAAARLEIHLDIVCAETCDTSHVCKMEASPLVQSLVQPLVF